MDKGMQSLARALASEDKTKRDDALKSLKLFISTRIENEDFFDLAELKKLWKCLFYCMWSCDNMVRQEKLSKLLSKLTPLFVKIRQKMSFIKAFFFIVKREWLGLDTHRQDKYLFLIRVVMRSGFNAISEENLSLTSLKLISSTYQNHVLNVENATASSVEYHVCDIFFDEAAHVIGDKLGNEVFMRICYPFLHYLKYGKDSKLSYHIIMNMFLELTGFSKYSDKKSLNENVGKISIDRNAFAAHVSSLAMCDDIRETNRNRLMFFVQRWKRQTLELDSLESSAREALEMKKLQKEKKWLREEKEIETELEKAGLVKVQGADKLLQGNSSVKYQSSSVKLSCRATEGSEEDQTLDRIERVSSGDNPQQLKPIFSKTGGNNGERNRNSKGENSALNLAEQPMSTENEKIFKVDNCMESFRGKNSKKKVSDITERDSEKDVKEEQVATEPLPTTKTKRKKHAVRFDSDADSKHLYTPGQSTLTTHSTERVVDAKTPIFVKNETDIPVVCDDTENNNDIEQSSRDIVKNTFSAFQIKQVLQTNEVNPKLSRDQKRRSRKQEEKSKQLKQFRKRVTFGQEPDAMLSTNDVENTHSSTVPFSADFVTTPISEELRHAYVQTKSANSTPKLGANFVKIDKVPWDKPAKKQIRLTEEEIDMLPSFTRRFAENTTKSRLLATKNKRRRDSKELAFGRTELAKSSIVVHRAAKPSAGRVSFDLLESQTSDNSDQKETSL
ncbi:uncharacterized protein LOC142355845 [Convolutriloba macropyga]|uniref:uncharacterized protein LOC142355845 n=1 Tax=Convolutriloba macropyga TaxID=536237 RepID=UPI003F51B177